MYVPYKCCEKTFADYYVQQTGSGGVNYYQGAAFQKGYGLGGLFRSIFRAAVPLFKSGAKAVGKQLLHSGVGMLSDVTRGDDPKVAAKRRLKEAGQQLTNKAATKINSMIGIGKKHKKRKRVKKSMSSRRNKKAKTHGIFS